MANQGINPFRDYELIMASFFAAPIAEVTASIELRWNKDLGPFERLSDGSRRARYHLTPVTLDFRYAYVNSMSYPTREGWNPKQALFWEPANAPGTTMMMTNSCDGNKGQVCGISKRVDWACVYAEFGNKTVTMQDLPYSHFFHYYKNFMKIEREIGIGVETNGRWVFATGGPIQEFENPEYNSRRRIRDRLSREVFVEYLGKLGWDITSPQCWNTAVPAIVLWDDYLSRRTGPGRDGVDPEGTRTGWTPQRET